MISSLTTLMNGIDVSLALLEILAENTFDSILITDASDEFKIIYANEAFEKLTGYDRDSVIGNTPSILQGVGTDPKVIATLSNAITSGIEFDGKAINYKKDGTPFIMHWRVIPVKENNDIVAWVAIQRERFFI